MKISFTVPGRISGKGRPKFARRGKFVTAYTPEKTRNAEAMVREFAALAMRGEQLLVGPLRLSVIISINQPASWSKKKKADNPIPTGKPDLDNIVKLLGDSLNGIIWQDDSQIAELHIARQFQGGEGEQTKIYVGEMSARAA